MCLFQEHDRVQQLSVRFQYYDCHVREQQARSHKFRHSLLQIYIIYYRQMYKVRRLPKRWR